MGLASLGAGPRMGDWYARVIRDLCSAYAEGWSDVRRRGTHNRPFSSLL